MNMGNTIYNKKIDCPTYVQYIQTSIVCIYNALRRIGGNLLKCVAQPGFAAKAGFLSYKPRPILPTTALAASQGKKSEVPLKTRMKTREKNLTAEGAKNAEKKLELGTKTENISSATPAFSADKAFHLRF